VVTETPSPIWPLANEVARIIVACAHAFGDDPIKMAGGQLGMRSRLYAYLCVALDFPTIPRRESPSANSLVGGPPGYEGTVRNELRRPKWFDVEELNVIREEIGARRVTLVECIESTYQIDRGQRGIRRNRRARESAAASVPAVVPKLTDAEIESIPGEVLNDQPFPVRKRATELAMARRQVNAILPTVDLNYIPSRAEQIAASGSQLVVTRGGDEPSFERSALAERLRNPKEQKPQRECADEAFAAGYMGGLHSDGEVFPDVFSDRGPSYRAGWIKGKANRMGDQFE
jgi:hypothetical protein